MYALLGIDAILRIAAAMVFLFVMVPYLGGVGRFVIPSVERGTRAGGVPPTASWNPPHPGPSLNARDDIHRVSGLQRFWLSFATGTVALTLLGQLLTLVNAYASLTLLLACGALIVIARG